jgi:hypothetical protein
MAQSSTDDSIFLALQGFILRTSPLSHCNTPILWWDFSRLHLKNYMAQLASNYDFLISASARITGMSQEHLTSSDYLKAWILMDLPSGCTAEHLSLNRGIRMAIIKKMRRNLPVAHSWNASYLKGWYMTSGGLMFQTTTTAYSGKIHLENNDSSVDKSYCLKGRRPALQEWRPVVQPHSSY